MCSPQEVVCFKCYKTFSKLTKSEQCKKCGDYKCPLCLACMCNLTIGEKKVVMAMMQTYEAVLNKGYDFSLHKEVEEEIQKTL